MNENIDLTKILKNCPVGWKLYSPLFGEVEFQEIRNDNERAIVVTKGVIEASFTKDGWYYADLGDECLLFPSKNQRDWSKFSAPWYQNEKNEKFDPRTPNPFDKVLVKSENIFNWNCSLFSNIDDFDSKYPFTCLGLCYKYCIPYNNDTKHLVGTAEEAPEHYRYWED